MGYHSKDIKINIKKQNCVFSIKIIFTKFCPKDCIRKVAQIRYGKKLKN